MRQFHDDAAAEPKCANPLTAQDLRRERVKLAHGLLVLIQEDIDSNAPGVVQHLVAETVDALRALQEVLAGRNLPW